MSNALDIKKNILDSEGRPPKQQAEFLLQDSNMNGKYLGACLDSCRWGSYTTVMYEMSIMDMINFVQIWMKQNESNFKNLFYAKGMQQRIELPFINHDVCPRTKSEDKKHNGAVRDLMGRLRCANKSERRLKPSFLVEYDYFDEFSGMKKWEFYENAPSDEDEEELELFNQEEPSCIVTDDCYAILSDKGIVLSLEEILRRLNLRPEFLKVYCPIPKNRKTIVGIDRECILEKIAAMNREEKREYELSGLCPGHQERNDKIEFHFDGWTLANYVRKWWEQLSEKVPWTDIELKR